MSELRRSMERGLRFTVVMSMTALMLVACGKGKGQNGSNSAPREPFPYLGKSATFAVLAGQAVNNTGATVVYGDIGVSQGSNMTGLATIKRMGGEIHPADTLAVRAQNDSNTAYKNIKEKACEHNLTGRDLGGMTLVPGTYCFDGDATLNGLLTLDFKGDINASFLFQMTGDLRTGVDSGIRMLNKGETCNVFWLVPGSANLSAMTNFIGGIMSIGDINMGQNAKLNGKVMSRSGNVNLNSNEIYNNFCPWSGN